MTLPIEPIDREAAYQYWCNTRKRTGAITLDEAFARHRIAERERCVAWLETDPMGDRSDEVFDLAQTIQSGAHAQSTAVTGIPAAEKVAAGYLNGGIWTTSRPDGLEQAISLFKEKLPGWWYSVCECQISCDASCAPTRDSADLELADRDDRFNSGFHVDLAQPSTLAAALTAVMEEALAARAIRGEGL